MKLEDIIKQLIFRLPRYTNLFSEEVSVIANSYDSNTGLLSLETADPHGLSIGSDMTIIGALYNIPITELTYDDITRAATAKTSIVNDLSENPTCKRFAENGYGVQSNRFSTFVYDTDAFVEIQGADQAEYNGSFVFAGSPNTDVFQYMITDLPPTVPATGSPVLSLSVNPFNGFFKVVDVPSANELTVQIPQPFPLFDPSGDIKVRSHFRISGVIDEERAIDSYTAQQTNKLWAFAIRQDAAGESSFASQNRRIKIDAVDIFREGLEYRQHIIERFSIIIAIPTTSTISGRVQMDIIEDVKKYLVKSICGVLLPSVFEEPVTSGVTFVGENFGLYNSAFYIHRFNFERVVDIMSLDVAEQFDTVVVNQININYLQDQTPNELIMTDKISYEKDI